MPFQFLRADHYVFQYTPKQAATDGLALACDVHLQALGDVPTALFPYAGTKGAFHRGSPILRGFLLRYSTETRMRHRFQNRWRIFKAGNDLFFRPVAGEVPSALEGLTSVFEMGTGVPPPVWSPAKQRPAVSYQLSAGTHIENCIGWVSRASR